MVNLRARNTLLPLFVINSFSIPLWYWQNGIMEWLNFAMYLKPRCLIQLRDKMQISNGMEIYKKSAWKTALNLLRQNWNAIKQNFIAPLISYLTNSLSSNAKSYFYFYKLLFRKRYQWVFIRSYNCQNGNIVKWTGFFHYHGISVIQGPHKIANTNFQFTL